jgi:hypothetical protein
MTSRFHLHVFIAENDVQVHGLVDRDLPDPIIITKLIFDREVVDLATYPMNNLHEWERVHREVAFKLGVIPSNNRGRPALTQ